MLLIDVNILLHSFLDKKENYVKEKMENVVVTLALDLHLTGTSVFIVKLSRKKA